MKVTDLLEYGRIVHAEMAAICDAARRGIKLKGTTLYCTTYPCHMCAKLILAVGITKVIYIDPYPKSKATELFDDIVIEGVEKQKDKQVLAFEAFSGVAPKRFQFLFKQESRKCKGNKIDVLPATRHEPTYLQSRNPINYIIREKCVLIWIKKNFTNKIFIKKYNAALEFNPDSLISKKVLNDKWINIYIKEIGVKNIKSTNKIKKSLKSQKKD
ncbi:MAG: deaminase [Gammaproteobacteria bacterium]